MKCPYCSNPETKVVDKRDAESLSATRRRRECLGCGKRFTTYERIESAPLFVIKKDGTRQSFDRNKLMGGILRACEKRPVEQKQIDEVVDEIEAEIRNQPSTDIKSSFIGELVSKKLKRLDKIAYIRFASVYREFEDVTDFGKEVDKLMKKK